MPPRLPKSVLLGIFFKLITNAIGKRHLDDNSKKNEKGSLFVMANGFCFSKKSRLESEESFKITHRYKTGFMTADK